MSTYRGVSHDKLHHCISLYIVCYNLSCQFITYVNCFENISFMITVYNLTIYYLSVVILLYTL